MWCNTGMVTDSARCTAVGPAGNAGKPPLAERSLVTPEQAADVVGLFKMLGNETRLRLLHGMHREGEVTVGDLAEQVGLRVQAVSNQLQRLSDRGIVTARRDGSRIWYSIADPCVPAVLDLALCLIEETAARR
jgi:DNA-binding transcriptional ArsR family regulator